MFDIVIIGCGCAGMTAALYALRAGCTVKILEGEGIGGQISVSPHVENFPSIKQISGSEFSDNMFEQVTAIGADFGFERVNEVRDGEIKTVITDENKYECKAIIIAAGVKNRPLPVENFSDYVGKGISFCAVCDGVFFKNKNVAVVGGGNTALQDALYLSKYCNKVTLIHRRDTFRGDNSTVEQLKDVENVEFLLDSTVTAISAEAALNGITVENVKTGEKTDVAIDGLFCAVGQIPQNDIFASVAQLDKGGYIDAGEDCKTKTAGIFVAGDCRAKEVRQLTTAAADGAVAALAAAEFIRTK